VRLTEIVIFKSHCLGNVQIRKYFWLKNWAPHFLQSSKSAVWQFSWKPTYLNIKCLKKSSWKSYEQYKYGFITKLTCPSLKISKIRDGFFIFFSFGNFLLSINDSNISILILCTENPKIFIEVLDELELFIDKKVIFDGKNFPSVRCWSINFVIRIIFFLSTLTLLLLRLRFF
jgi:hypothetical protein